MAQPLEDKISTLSKPRASEHEEKEEREHNLDKTIADSFPASDPPSTIPDPDHDEDEAA